MIALVNGTCISCNRMTHQRRPMCARCKTRLSVPQRTALRYGHITIEEAVQIIHRKEELYS